MLIIGLDVSTSVVGLCIVDSSIQPDALGSNIVLLDRIEFKGCRTLWEKADAVRAYLSGLKMKMKMKNDGEMCYPETLKIVLEEPLMGFRAGMSSAQTITTLMRFNGIVSYIAHITFDIDPNYISAAHARKLCGIKMQKTAVAGPQKEQVFDYMRKNDLQHVVWPTKKNGSIVDWSRDACDAYVIARAACLIDLDVEPPKKAKKPKAK